MKDLIAKLKEKPEHVRKRIAMGVSVGSTALVAVIWATTMATSGTLALATGSDTGSADQPTKPDSYALSGASVQSNFSQLLGAVGAATNGTTSKPALTIVDGGTSSTFATTSTHASNNQSATSIAF